MTEPDPVEDAIGYLAEATCLYLKWETTGTATTRDAVDEIARSCINLTALLTETPEGLDPVGLDAMRFRSAVATDLLAGNAYPSTGDLRESVLNRVAALRGAN
jgi:hypothetical protein